MIGTIRQLMRNRKIARRIARDDERERLLESEGGRRAYWEGLAAECAESSLIALLEQALAYPGDIVECGVFRGDSLRRIAKTVKERAPGKTVFGLDSFEGFPPGGITSLDISSSLRSQTRLEGKFKGADDVPARLMHFAKAFDIDLDLRRGYFEATLPGIRDRDFCFIHIDCDTYSGHVEVLEALYDRLVPGGVIVYDDYGSEAWPGATRAVDEFLADKADTIRKSEERIRPAWYSIKVA
jgi:SAM-dependent methyltransferase